MKPFKVVFEAMINILGLLGFECVTDRIHKLHNSNHKLFGAGFIAFYFLSRYALGKSDRQVNSPNLDDIDDLDANQTHSLKSRNVECPASQV